MAQSPDLVLADHLLAELSPTQARAVADALLAEQKRLGFALLYAARGTLVTTWLSGRVFVLRSGRIVEEGPVARLSSPQAHAYTQTLYRALGKPSADAALKQGSRGEPILQVRGLKLAEQKDDRRNREGLTFDLRRGSGVALIGEAGSGRRELVRALLGLEKPAEGRTIFDSVDIGVLSKAMVSRLRRRVAFVTGDDDALDPRMSVHDTVEEPLRAHLGLSRQHMSGSREAALKRVGLNTLDGNRTVASLSPFDRRRLQIARAIVSVPRLAVIEEPQRGLGPLEQAVMLDLLKEFRVQEGPAFLVLTANFSLAQALANDAMVFKDGRVVERGPMADILRTPKDAYTKSLIAAVTPAPLDTLSQTPPAS
jgi:ABC-type glutathione transport system ATPase component